MPNPASSFQSVVPSTSGSQPVQDVLRRIQLSDDLGGHHRVGRPHLRHLHHRRRQRGGRLLLAARPPQDRHRAEYDLQRNAVAPAIACFVFDSFHIRIAELNISAVLQSGPTPHGAGPEFRRRWGFRSEMNSSRPTTVNVNQTASRPFRPGDASGRCCPPRCVLPSGHRGIRSRRSGGGASARPS